MVYKIGWFSTGRGPGSRNLLTTVLEHIDSGRISAEISFVFCNREKGEAEGSDRYLQLVKDRGLNLISFSSRNFKPAMRRQGRENPTIMNEWRNAYDLEILPLLAAYSSDINVLAGYLLILSHRMCDTYDFINLHPAAPDGPAGTWKEVIWQLIQDRSQESGVMIHLVTRKLDQGPPITYCTFPLRGGSIDPLWEIHERSLYQQSLDQIIRDEGEKNPLFKEIRERGVKRELPLIVHTLKHFSQGKIRIENHQVLVDDQLQQHPFCLTAQIEASLTTGQDNEQ